MSKRKLLLADDSITIQKVVNLTFADEGIEVIAVGDGDSAIQKFDEFIPDLVMADVNMPGLTGYEVCQVIKRNESTRHIPVILLVGSFEPFDEEAARDAGADDYLTKPFQSIRQLVNKVTDLLAAGSGNVEHADDGSEDSVENIETAELQQSETIDEPAEVSPNETELEAPTSFGDDGLDDEMIDATPVSNFGYTSFDDYRSDSTIDYAKTQPLNAADLKGFSLVGNDDDESVDQSPTEVSDSAEAAPHDEVVDDVEATTLATPETTEADADDSGLYDYDSTPDSVANEFVAEPQLERIEDESPVETATEEFSAGSAEIESETAEGSEEAVSNTGSANDEEQPEDAETVPVTEEETESADSEVAVTEPGELTETTVDEAVAPETTVDEPAEVAAVADAEPVSMAEIDLEDGDLLELPPLVEETGIRPVVGQSETEEVPTDVPVTTPVAESSQAFPPELIDAIAKKVAEQISAKTLSDVLPQITELVMKKMAEEKKE